MTPLAALIRTRIAALEINVSEVARRGNTSRQLVDKWANLDEPAERMPTADTLERLARGLALPTEALHEAAIQSSGYRMTAAAHGTTATVLVMMDVALDDVGRQDVLDYVMFRASQTRSRPPTSVDS